MSWNTHKASQSQAKLQIQIFICMIIPESGPFQLDPYPFQDKSSKTSSNTKTLTARFYRPLFQSHSPKIIIMKVNNKHGYCYFLQTSYFGSNERFLNVLFSDHWTMYWLSYEYLGAPNVSLYGGRKESDSRCATGGGKHDFSDILDTLLSLCFPSFNLSYLLFGTFVCCI